MSLLERIAYSNGDPQRALTALRLINERLKHVLSQHVDSKVCQERLLAESPPTGQETKGIGRTPPARDIVEVVT